MNEEQQAAMDRQVKRQRRQMQDQLSGKDGQIDTLRTRLAEAQGIIRELVAAFREYEMDVDTTPPQKHKAMMARAEKGLKE